MARGKWAGALVSRVMTGSVVCDVGAEFKGPQWRNVRLVGNLSRDSGILWVGGGAGGGHVGWKANTGGGTGLCPRGEISRIFSGPQISPGEGLMTSTDFTDGKELHAKTRRKAGGNESGVSFLRPCASARIPCIVGARRWTRSARRRGVRRERTTVAVLLRGFAAYGNCCWRCVVGCPA
jgi:hypothetical protein